MSLQNVARAAAVLILIDAGLTVHRQGWTTYKFPALLCLTGCFLLVEPRRKDESMWTRLHRPKQIATTVLALAAMVLLTLSMLAGNA